VHKIARAADVAIDEDPRVASYQCMYGSAKSIPGMTDNVFWESHGPGVATQFASSGDRSYFSILKRMKEPMKDHHIFNDEEKNLFFKEIGETSVTATLKAKYLPQYCTWTRLAYQIEGFSKKWYYGRIVLCGEATTQMTSIAGMGFNAALQSAVVLANKIHAVVQSNQRPDLNALTTAFAEYQTICQVETKAVSELSAMYVRAVTWSSWFEWFFMEYLSPWIWGEKKMMMKLGADVIAKGRTLDFVMHEEKHGKIPWINQ
jgi:2-polyprenyl-6-methoxyphenol hydroxylase-like FAD-dependent oxidoreductase